MLGLWGNRTSPPLLGEVDLATSIWGNAVACEAADASTLPAITILHRDTPHTETPTTVQNMDNADGRQPRL